MRKIFTLTIAVLASFSLMADDFVLKASTATKDDASDPKTHVWAFANGPTFTLSPQHGGTGQTGYEDYIKLSKNKTYTINLPADFNLTNMNIKGYTNSNGKTDGEITKIGSDTQSGKKFPAKDDANLGTNACITDGYDFAFTQKGGSITFTTANTNQLCVLITLTGTEDAPTSAVFEVVVDGKAACFLGKSIALSATPDVKATNFKWSVNGVDQAGAESSSFEFTPAAVGNYAIVCSAKNALNSDWVASTTHNVEVIAPYTRSDVTAATTWDFSKSSAKSEIKFTASTDPKKDETCLLANVDDVKNDADFNSQAMEFAGEFVIRNSSYSQGKLWQFKTTVAGWVKVWFSNTGTKDDPRYVAINEVVNTTTGSKNETIVETPYIAVEAGDVKIEGSFDPYNAQYLRISKIVFRTTDPTAIDNTEAEVKTVKTFENGQLIIIKNGIKYNATGAIVK